MTGSPGSEQAIQMNVAAFAENRHAGYKKSRLFFASSLALAMAGINAAMRANAASDLQ
jgi:hypothetical protein